MWKVHKGQRIGMCHGAADEESAEKAMDAESAEGEWMKKVLIEGTLPEGADRILALGV